MAVGTGAPARTPVQIATVVVAVVFLLVGVLGFVPGITTNYDQLTFAGHMSGAALLGIFNVSILHNIVHLLFGVVGLLAARTPGGARSYLLAGGIIYLVLFIYGLVIPMDGPANFVPVNSADNVLHLILAIGMVGLGVALGRQAPAVRR
jgi:hypothetical protein